MGPGGGNARVAPGAATQRLDKWLWFARLAKSRTLAAALVSRGKIRVNKARIDKPSQTVKCGDVVTAAIARSVRVLKIEALGTRRGPATEAQTLYEDLTPQEDRIKSAGAGGLGDGRGRVIGLQSGAREPGSGRPTKRERRQLDKIRDMPD